MFYIVGGKDLIKVLGLGLFLGFRMFLGMEYNIVCEFCEENRVSRWSLELLGDIVLRLRKEYILESIIFNFKVRWLEF